MGHDVFGEDITIDVNSVNGTYVANYAGNPNGHVLAVRIGDLCIDTANGLLYQATVADNAHWEKRGTSSSQGATAGASAAFGSDTYLAGSKIVIPVAGSWHAGTAYRCVFDMAKTNAGTATPLVVLRIGTAGTTGDAAILTFTFGIGSTAADTGVFEVNAQFRSIGATTAAVVAGVAELRHQLASTGLTTTGTAGYQAVPVASAGFDSTASTTIGVSFNGGASFSGTNVMCDSWLINP